MSCDNSKFIITKGSDNTFTFTIKQDNSTLPLTIMEEDVFTASLIDLETNTPHPLVNNKPLVVENALNGRVVLNVSKEDTADLVSIRGGRVDRFYLNPSYKLLITCKTAINGDFIAKVQEVYVD